MRVYSHRPPDLSYLAENQEEFEDFIDMMKNYRDVLILPNQSTTGKIIVSPGVSILEAVDAGILRPNRFWNMKIE